MRRLKTDEKRPLTSSFAAAAEGALEVASIPVAPATSSEKRRSPRYKCEGSAEFRVGGTDVRTWGTFTDLSVHGCYIEMTAPFPVGATDDLVLSLNGTFET